MVWTNQRFGGSEGESGKIWASGDANAVHWVAVLGYEIDKHGEIQLVVADSAWRGYDENKERTFYPVDTYPLREFQGIFVNMVCVREIE